MISLFFLPYPHILMLPFKTAFPHGAPKRDPKLSSNLKVQFWEISSVTSPFQEDVMKPSTRTQVPLLKQ